jgi:tetratricopeptide (TPR) repeat protein
MKKSYVISGFALMLSLSAMAQKDQLKQIEKALKSGNSVEAKSILDQTASLITSATDAEKAQYYFLKGNTYLDLGNKGKESNYVDAATAYQELLKIEKASGKSKFTNQAQNSIKEIREKMINSAIEDGKKNKFNEAADKFHKAYEIDPSDLNILFYSASYYVNGKDYDKALVNYQELLDKGFTGEGSNYFAKNVAGVEEQFPSKEARDLAVKFKTHNSPKDEKVASKKTEIATNVAFILAEKGENEKALAAIKEAKKLNPKNISLIITEANILFKLNDLEGYKKVINEAIQLQPNNAELFYNLGVVSGGSKEVAKAEEYYKKAIELDPKYTNAYLNLAILKLDADNAIVEEMNNLGTSAKDNKRYEELKVIRKKVFQDALPYLEKVYELAPENEDARRTLANVYLLLEMQDKYKAIKATLK